MKCCRVFANVVGKVYVVAVRKLRRFWSKGGHKMVDDYRVSAYIKVSKMFFKIREFPCNLSGA